MKRQKTQNQNADKPFDVLSKQLIAAHPADWLALVGISDAEATPIEVVDADLATLVQQADRVLLRGGTAPELFDLEIETGHHGNKLAERLLVYSVALTQKYALPVQSIVFLLRKEADSPLLTGVYERLHAGGAGYLHFSYRVVRVWQLPVETLLRGGLATLPLAPIADVSESDLPQVIARMRERLDGEPDNVQQEAWISTYYLLGMRLSDAAVTQLLKGIGTMFESSTYNATIEKGRTQGVAQGVAQGELNANRAMLLRVGTHQLGEPSAAVVARLNEITSAAAFLPMMDAVWDAATWDDVVPGT